jgi:hypothetical protein
MHKSMKEVVEVKIQHKINAGIISAQAAIDKLVSEGKIAKDFIAPLGTNLTLGSEPVLTFRPDMDETHVKMIVSNAEIFTMHENSVLQAGEKLGINQSYLHGLAYSKSPWQISLAAHILNQHSLNTQRERVLIRAVGSEVRGILSDQYRRLNSELIVMAFLEMAISQGASLCDGYMNDTKIWIETLMPNVFEIPTEKNGMRYLAFGSRLSSSDYGNAALDLRSFIIEGICLNGMVRESVMKVVHLGARLPDNLALSERTFQLDTETQCSAIKDLTKGFFAKEAITERAFEIQRASDMDVDLVQELKGLFKSSRLYKDEVTQIEKVFMNGNPDDGIQGQNTLLKLVNGITAHARIVTSERSRELQEIAGDLMNRVKK